MTLHKPQSSLDRPACRSAFTEYLISNTNRTETLSILVPFDQKQRRFFTYRFNSVRTVTEISVTLFVKCILAATYMKAQCMSRRVLGQIASACAADLENACFHFALTPRNKYVKEE